MDHTTGAADLHRRWATLAARMADVTDSGDRPTAIALLRQAEEAAELPRSDPTAPLVVLARRFARAHGEVLRRTPPSTSTIPVEADAAPATLRGARRSRRLTPAPCGA